MRCLTVHPEWAACMVLLGKRIENRKRRLPPKYVGERMALHAGKYIGGSASKAGQSLAVSRLKSCGVVGDDLERVLEWARTHHSHLFASFEVGEPLDRVSEGQQRWCFEHQTWNPLLDFRPLDPPEGPTRGKQGYWEPPRTTQLRRHAAERLRLLGGEDTIQPGDMQRRHEDPYTVSVWTAVDPILHGQDVDHLIGPSWSGYEFRRWEAPRG